MRRDGSNLAVATLFKAWRRFDLQTLAGILNAGLAFNGSMAPANVIADRSAKAGAGFARAGLGNNRCVLNSPANQLRTVSWTLQLSSERACFWQRRLDGRAPASCVSLSDQC